MREIFLTTHYFAKPLIILLYQYFHAMINNLTSKTCYTNIERRYKPEKKITFIYSDCPVDHPDINLTEVKVTSTKIGTILTYTCTSNTSITLTSTCRGDGTWTSAASLCPNNHSKIHLISLYNYAVV